MGEEMKRMNKDIKPAIEALNRLGIAASQAGETLRKFADAYEDMKLSIRRLYFVRLP